jgi:integrase
MPGVTHVWRTYPSTVRRGHQQSSTHPLTGSEIRALRKRQRLVGETAYVFFSERKGPLTDASVRKMIARAGGLAGLGVPVHSHQLRHGCGYKLANDKQDTRAIQLFLGHRNIQHTVNTPSWQPSDLRTFGGMNESDGRSHTPYH